MDRLERLIQQDAQNIHELAQVAKAHQAAIEGLRDTVAQLVREWQAYLRRAPQ